MGVKCLIAQNISQHNALSQGTNLDCFIWRPCSTLAKRPPLPPTGGMGTPLKTFTGKAFVLHSRKRQCSVSIKTGGGGVPPYKGLMGTCGQPGYVFRDFCLKQGIEFIIFCLNQGIDLSIFVLNRMSFLGR